MWKSDLQSWSSHGCSVFLQPSRRAALLSHLVAAGLPCFGLTLDLRCRRGEAVTVFDGRPNSELILATGLVEDDSAADYLTISVGLVQTDRMFSTKKEILKAMGFEAVQVLSLFV